MSYYWFNRQELFWKAKHRYHNTGGKNVAAEYYTTNKDVLKEKAKSTYRNLSEEGKKTNQKRNIAEICAETWKKMEAKRVLKK